MEIEENSLNVFLKMHYILTLVISLLLLPCFNSFAQHQPYDHHRYMEWNEFYKLRWENFNAIAKEGTFGDAGTVVKIMAKPYYVGKKIAYNVYALFNKQDSWARERGDHLLAHEQLHFDIAELYARKIRKRIAALSAQKENDLGRFNREINKLLIESNEVDAQYDLETLHGALKPQQALWQEKIDREMKVLKPYQRSAEIIGRH